MSCPSAPLEQNYFSNVGGFNGKHAKEDKSYLSNISSEKISYYRCDRKWATYMVYTAWWRHQMETFPRYWPLCAGNSPVTGKFPQQRPVTQSFVVLCDLRLKNGCVNNRDAGDLRRHRAHCDVIVMDHFDSNCHDQFQFEERETKLSHLHLDKMAAILAEDILKCISWMKIIEFRFEFHWNLFPGVQLTISQHWFR